MKKGNAISIKTILKNISHAEDVNYQYILIRYFHERLIYRIVNSEYCNSFFLKGGALLYAIEGLHVRPTVDIDMLAQQISNDVEQIKQIFRAVCSLEYHDDCVVFDTERIETKSIAEDDKYSGVRVLIEAGLDTIRQLLQIDIGFSDIITPAPITLIYPVLIAELAKPIIQACSIETVIAEKFHAMIILGNFNSRMKDFYDVYILLKNNEIKEEILKEAVLQTFINRNTGFVECQELFNESFVEDRNRQVMWNAFLRKMKIKGVLDFPITVKTILERLQPIYNELSKANRAFTI